MEKQQEVIKHFDNDVQSSLEDAEEAIRDRWKRISMDLKKREPHSHKRLDITLFRENVQRICTKEKAEMDWDKDEHPIFPSSIH